MVFLITGNWLKIFTAGELQNYNGEAEDDAL